MDDDDDDCSSSALVDDSVVVFHLSHFALPPNSCVSICWLSFPLLLLLSLSKGDRVSQVQTGKKGGRISWILPGVVYKKGYGTALPPSSHTRQPAITSSPFSGHTRILQQDSLAFTQSGKHCKLRRARDSSWNEAYKEGV